jgi:DNA-binding response OmpR family regulator
MKILVVEDETSLANGLRFNLIAEGCKVEIAADGETALSLILGDKRVFDLIVLDVMMPGIDGFEVAQTLRKSEIFTPILMLTARGSSEDVLRGFAAGADDYLPKPFDLEIFLARVRSLLRRREWFCAEAKKPSEKMFVEFDGKLIDFENLELKSGDKIFKLTLMEAKLLRHLIGNAGKTISRESILRDVWNLHADTDTRAIDNFIVRLRRYIEPDPANPRYLITVRGVGYRFLL